MTTFDTLRPNLINRIKAHLLKNYLEDILAYFGLKLSYILYQYTKHLPMHVAQNEREDLQTICQLELIETFKSWDVDKSEDMWPLAYHRINGAMKDHIRYLTKSDPSRFYDWITDAAYFFITLQESKDFTQEIENGTQLSHAMQALTPRERMIIIEYIYRDRTFKEIGDQLEISESQISRIYKQTLEKLRKILQ